MGDRTREIIDQVPALARSCRQDGTTEFLSRRWLDYTGLTEKKALGWGWKNAIPPEDSEKLMEPGCGVLTPQKSSRTKRGLRALTENIAGFWSVLRPFGTNRAA